MDNKEEVKKDLNEMRHQINRMKTSPETSDYAEDLNQLENRRSRLESEVDGLPSNDHSAWERIKGGVRNSINEIKSEIEQFRGRMRK